MSIANWLGGIALAAAAAVQTESSAAEIERVLRALAGGGAPVDGFRVETQCRDEGRFVTAAVHGSGAAIWNQERQGVAAPEQIKRLIDALVREDFARMPRSFGEQERDDERFAVKMTCLVRFIGGGVQKDVIQLDKGQQSPALKRLARAIVDVTRAAATRGMSAASLDEGLGAVADARLAPETLRITMRAGPAGGTAGWILRLDGRDLEIEPDAGPRARRRLDAEDVRALARALRESGFPALPANVHSEGYTELTAAVLAHERAVLARPFAAKGAQDPVMASRFRQAVAPLLALRR